MTTITVVHPRAGATRSAPAEAAPSQAITPAPQSSFLDIFDSLCEAESFSWSVSRNGRYFCILDDTAFDTFDEMKLHYAKEYNMAPSTRFMNKVPIERLLTWTFATPGHKGPKYKPHVIARYMKYEFKHLSDAECTEIAETWVCWTIMTFTGILLCKLLETDQCPSDLSGFDKPSPEVILPFFKHFRPNTTLAKLSSFWKPVFESLELLPGEMHEHFTWYVDQDGRYRPTMPNSRHLSFPTKDELITYLRGRGVATTVLFANKIPMERLLECAFSKTSKGQAGNHEVGFTTRNLRDRKLPYTLQECKSIVYTFITWMQTYYGGSLQKSRSKCGWDVSEASSFKEFLDIFGLKYVEDARVVKAAVPKKRSAPNSSTAITSTKARRML